LFDEDKDNAECGDDGKNGAGGENALDDAR
jgi:hypothetical protein